MSKSKKALSALLAVASVAGVVAPSVTAVAATNVDNLIDTALAKKTFVDYFNAYAAIVQLPQAEQGKYLVKLAPVEKQIPDYANIVALYNKVIAFSTNKDVATYDYLCGDGSGTNGAIVDQVKTNKADRDFLFREVYTYALNVIEKDQKPVQDARHALVDVMNAVAKKDLAAAKAALAKAKEFAADSKLNAANKAYLADELKVYDKGVADLEAAQTLTVASVSSTNLKEITVTYNKVVDKTTAEDIANYTLSAGTVSGAVLDSTGKVVTLTLTAAASQQASVDVTVKNVKDAAGTKIADTTKNVKFFDAVVPSVTGVQVTGPTKVKVTFSEPITSTNITATSNFAIDNYTYSISSVAAVAGDNHSVEITLGATLPEGTHKLTVNATTGAEIKDFAGFVVPKADFAFDYKQDKVAPVVNIDKISQNSVTLKFSKDIDTATQSYLSVYHTYNNVSGYMGSVSWTDNRTAVITFAANYLPIGNATLYVNGGSGTSLVKDNWGNTFAATTLTSNVVADTTAPTVTEVKVVDATHIDVTYSESVTGANTASNYTLKDSTGATVAVTSATNTTGNTYRLTTATLSGGAFSLTVKGIKDTSVAQNAMADYTTGISVSDLIAPTVNTAGVYSTDKKKVVIGFSEAMSTTSVLDKANYQVSVDGSTYADLSTFTGATLSLGADGKSVVIDFGTAQSFTGSSKVRVARVTDLAGNKTAGFTTDVALAVDDVVAANISEGKAVAANKVQFKVNTALSGIDVSKFTIASGGVSRTAIAATYVNSGNTSIVTVTIADTYKFGTDLTGLTNVTIAAGGLTTALGTQNSASVTFTTFDDYVAPTLDKVETADSDSDNKIDQIKLTFSEALYIPSVQESDFTVEGYQVTGLSTTNNVVTLTVKELDVVDTGATPKVTLVGSVADNTTQRNSLGNLAAITATDKLAAVATGDFTATDTKVVTVNFSEAMDATTLVQGNFTSTAGGAITSFVKASDNKSVTITFTNGLTTGDTVSVSNVKDLAGNITIKNLTK